MTDDFFSLLVPNSIALNLQKAVAHWLKNLRLFKELLLCAYTIQ